LGALVASVIDEALRTFEDRKEFSRTIIAVKQRVAELEGQLKTGECALGCPDRPAADKHKKRLLEEITTRLRQGEINLPPYPQIAIKLRRSIRDQALSARITSTPRLTLFTIS
jgi:hypothetical protein